MTSIREVAKLAGVSPATVSRVMNGTANVNEEKKKRVEAAIKETGFQPNELARALYKKSSKMIGMIVPDIENPFFSELAKAVGRYSISERIPDSSLQFGWRRREGGCKHSDVQSAPGRWNRCDDELRRDRESVGGLSDTGRPC